MRRASARATVRQMPHRMPVLFVGHGSPANALGDNPYRRAFAAMGRAVPRPRAVVCVSAHWFVAGTWLTDNARPRTIHDFGGFDDALYAIRYDAAGYPVLATAIAARLAPFDAKTSSEWGLDHGAWTVLMHMFPDADVPVLQLSIDGHADAARHLAIGRALRPLRDDGVLILGSGNVTHDLRDAFARMQTGDTTTPEWASQFDQAAARALRERDDDALVAIWPSKEGRLAHPSPDHWWPLLYAFGASDERDAVTFPVEGFDLGSLSMRSVRFG